MAAVGAVQEATAGDANATLAGFRQNDGQFFLTLCAKRPNIDRMIANATFLRRRSQPQRGLLLCA
ncbi:hypothetical protein [Herbaspirillum sp.]|uniref:hypothetical protein n=1 Tax=Herbaspirillum sp. TaxID=1890675 RepID=UPI0031D93DC1